MRIVVIGDVGWSNFYHLGDEAMTELAIDELRRRDSGDQITLIAGDPEHARELYDVESISRIGFRGGDRRFNERRQRQVLEHVQGKTSLGEDDSAVAVIEAVRDADAVLVAGGGNLNSMFPQHIFERETLCRIAQHFEVPYGFTSQTVGPRVDPDDRRRLREVFSKAAFVGAREAHTHSLLSDFNLPDGVLYRMVDDAFSLGPREEDREAVADLTDGPFVIASFAEKPSSKLITQDDYHRLIASTLTQIAQEHDCRVLLVPHGAHPMPGQSIRDQSANTTIAHYAADDRVQTVRMITARELAALSEQALLVIGSRYHAGIFAVRAGVPAISLAPHAYSSIRMRGAHGNVGLDEFVFDIDSWRHGVVLEAVRVALQRREELERHCARVQEQRLAEHSVWWDFLLARLNNKRPRKLPVFEPVESFPLGLPSAWATSALLDATERLDQRVQEVEAKLRERSAQLDKANNEIAEIRDQLAASGATLGRHEAERQDLKREVKELRSRLTAAERFSLSQPVRLGKNVARGVKRRLKR